MPMILRLTRCTLRPWRADDAPKIVRHADNQAIAANLRDQFPHPYTLEDAQRWLAVALSREWVLAIEIDGEPVGGVGVHLFDDVYRRGAEVGYWLSEAHWGRGIATEAVTALSAEVFARSDLVRLQAGVFSSNLASMRVLEKAGFHLEGIRRRAVFKLGEILDEHLYCRLRP